MGETPELGKFYREHQNDTGFLVVALNDLQSNVEAFLAQNGASDLPVLLDSSGSIADSYGVTGIPTSVIIDKDGKIAQVKVGAVTAADLEAAVAPLR